MNIEGLDALDNKILEAVKDNNCRFHCRGYAPNNETLGSHVRYLYNHTEGIRHLECHVIMETYMDVDGGVEYVRYKESEHLESEQQ